MVLTAQHLLSIVGGSAEPFEKQCLVEADKRVTAFLKGKEQGGAFMDLDNAAHYTAIETLVTRLDGERLAGVAGKFKTLDAFVDAHAKTKTAPPELPSEVALEYIGIYQHAAYYFGLALGLRLAGGAR